MCDVSPEGMPCWPVESYRLVRGRAVLIADQSTASV